MSQTTIYIAGPMTGLPDFNYPAFNAAEVMLRELGYNVLNPARQPDGMEYEEYMQRGLADVEAAKVIVLLPGWNTSPGGKAGIGKSHPFTPGGESD